jgi:hypothetical protein
MKTISQRKLRIPTIILDLLILTGGFLTLYSACWLVPYLFTDDYANLAASYNGTLKESLEIVVAGGRSIYAISLLAAYTPMDSFSSLRILRFISIVGIGITSWLIYLNLCTSGWKRKSSLIGAYLIGTLPAFQVYASWSVAFVFPWATAITALSVQLLEFKTETNLTKKIFFVSLATFILILSLNIYQPAAMFFWVFAAIKIFIKYKNDFNTQIKKFFYYMLVFFSSLIVSFLILKITEILTNQKSSRSVIINNLHDVLGKLKWFITYPLVDSANFVNINSSYWFAFVVLTLIFIGSFFYLDGTFKRKITLIGISLSLVLFSYTPNLLVMSSLPSFRTQVALAALLMLFLYLSMEGLIQFIPRKSRLINIGLALIIPIFSFWTMYNVIVTIVVPQFTELANIRMQLPLSQLNTINKIYYIAPEDNIPLNSISPIKKYDEFGLPSSVATWAQKNAVYIVLHEISPKHRNIPIEVINKNYIMPNETNTLVIDTSQLWSLKSFFYH